VIIAVMNAISLSNAIIAEGSIVRIAGYRHVTIAQISKRGKTKERSEWEKSGKPTQSDNRGSLQLQ
jgi:hypothetical protein